MNFYFSQLLAMTGVKVGSPTAQPQATALTLPGASATPAPEPAPEIVEVIEVDESKEAVPASAIQPPSGIISTTIIEEVSPPRPSQVTPSALDPLFPQESPAPGSAAEKQFPPGHTGGTQFPKPRTLIEPRTETEPPSRALRAASIEVAPEQQSAGDAAQGEEAVKFTREEVLGVVMKWIASVETPRDAVGAVGQPMEAAHVSIEEKCPATQPGPTAAGPSAPPSRAIELESTTAEARLPGPQRYDPLDVPSRSVRSSADDMQAHFPSVSIGAIHLRIEAPVAPAAAPPPARATPSPTPARPRASTHSAGLLKLRRHYLLPH